LTLHADLRYYIWTAAAAAYDDNIIIMRP